jgi:phosphotriesterase-related protein
MKAVTVTGPVAGEELGVVLAHEHLLIDFTCRYTPAPDEHEVGSQPALEDRWRLLARPAGYRANLLGGDVESAIAEALAFKRSGGSTIVDLTGIGLQPDPQGLQRIAEATGLNVIAATGLYIDAALPPEVREASLEELAERLAEDVLTGGREGVRRGAIGEIAIESGSEVELKNVRAAARAQARTGAPCFFHVMSGILPEARPQVFELVDLYAREGGDLGRLVLCHQDGSGDDPDYQAAMLDRGLWFAYDTFGFESVFAFGERYIQLPTDTQRIREVKTLVDAGYGDRIVVSQDICYQMMKRSWGGWGYAHILDTLAPRFAAAGLGPEALRMLMVDNPSRLLCFA